MILSRLYSLFSCAMLLGVVIPARLSGILIQVMFARGGGGILDSNLEYRISGYFQGLYIFCEWALNFNFTNFNITND